MSRREHQLHRDTDNEKIGGVCSGLAHYFDLDPLLVRVVFIAALFVSFGVAIVAYLLLWWLIDPAPAGYWAERAGGTSATHRWRRPTGHLTG